MPQAGYKYLRSYQLTVIIYDLTVEFVKKWIDPRSRTKDQMEQCARSGKQNIAEGYLEKSLKSYIYLAGIARASLGELQEDFEDFLRQRKLELWSADHSKIKKFREFRVQTSSPNSPKPLIILNTPILPNDSEEAANLILTLIHQAQFLLNKQISFLEEKFIKEGGIYREFV